MIIAFLLSVAGVSATQGTDILAEVRKGKILCTNPDTPTKTCSTIDAFSPRHHGELLDTGEVLISPSPAITLQTSSIVKANGAQFCGVLMLEDLQHGILRIQGTPLPADRNTAALTKFADRMKGLIGRRVCEGLALQDGRLVRFGQIDGVDTPLPAKPVSWFNAADGYRVAPR